MHGEPGNVMYMFQQLRCCWLLSGGRDGPEDARQSSLQAEWLAAGCGGTVPTLPRWPCLSAALLHSFNCPCSLC